MCVLSHALLQKVTVDDGKGNTYNVSASIDTVSQPIVGTDGWVADMGYPGPYLTWKAFLTVSAWREKSSASATAADADVDAVCVLQCASVTMMFTPYRLL